MPYLFFSAADGNLLVRILIALLLALILDTWLPKKIKGIGRLAMKCGIAGLFTLGATLDFRLSIVLALCYSLILLATYLLTTKYFKKPGAWSAIEAMLMTIAAVMVWSGFAPGLEKLIAAAISMMLDYKASLIFLGYLIMLWPTSKVVKYSLLGINRSAAPTTQESPLSKSEPDAERGGRMIGMFERIIIFTLVLLNEYAAIGFLITGKSIIRFAQQKEQIRSEYVLVGTMVSYAIAIVTGVGINTLLKIS